MPTTTPMAIDSADGRVYLNERFELRRNPVATGSMVPEAPDEGDE